MSDPKPPVEDDGLALSDAAVEYVCAGEEEKETLWITQGLWDGQSVQVRSDCQCSTTHHSLVRMDHYGDEATGYLICSDCGGIAFEPPRNQDQLGELEAWLEEEAARTDRLVKNAPVGLEYATLKAKVAAFRAVLQRIREGNDG